MENDGGCLKAAGCCLEVADGARRYMQTHAEPCSANEAPPSGAQKPLNGPFRGH